MKAFPLAIALTTTLSIAWFPTHAATLATDGARTGQTTSWHSADAHQVWTRGTVVRVSIARGKVTIDHEPIENLDMMGMTMSFTAANPALLGELSAGDEIEFVADQDGDELVVKGIRRPAG